MRAVQTAKKVKKRARAHVDVDTLPSTEAFDAEVRTAWFVLVSLPRLYEDATAAATWLSGGEVHVTGGSVSRLTEAAALDPKLERDRERIKRAVEWMRKAADDAGKARSALLGNQVEQPTKVHPKATMTQAELDKKRQRRAELLTQSFSPDTP